MLPTQLSMIPSFLAESHISGERGRFLIDSLVDFVQRFRQKQFTSCQLALLCALVICPTENVHLELQQPGIAEEVYQRYKSLLRASLPNSDDSSTESITAVLTDLKRLQLLHQEKLQTVRFSTLNTPNLPSSIASSDEGTTSIENKDDNIITNGVTKTLQPVYSNGENGLKIEVQDECIQRMDTTDSTSNFLIMQSSATPVIQSVNCLPKTEVSDSGVYSEVIQSTTPAFNNQQYLVNFDASPYPVHSTHSSIVDRHRMIASLLSKPPQRIIPMAHSANMRLLPSCQEKPLNLCLSPK